MPSAVWRHSGPQVDNVILTFGDFIFIIFLVLLIQLVHSSVDQRRTEVKEMEKRAK